MMGSPKWNFQVQTIWEIEHSKIYLNNIVDGIRNKISSDSEYDISFRPIKLISDQISHPMVKNRIKFYIIE